MQYFGLWEQTGVQRKSPNTVKKQQKGSNSYTSWCEVNANLCPRYTQQMLNESYLNAF